MTDEDAYFTFEQHRLWFNKLWLADQLGYECGPCGTTPSISGMYIVRPIMNLIGMSARAQRLWLTDRDYNKIPPGYFWCEWFDGDQLSVTYEYNDEWQMTTAWQAERDVNNLSLFKKWSKIDNAPSLPSLCDELKDVGLINVEFIGDKIIEVHLRDTPDPDFEELIPIWEGQETKIKQLIEEGYTFIDDFDDADGFITHPRIGFMVK